MTLRTEFGSLSRELTPREIGLLSRYGHKGPPSKDIKRLLAAMLTESQGTGPEENLGLTDDEVEVLAYYLKYPEEASMVLGRYPPRTQAAQLCGAALDHYLLRHNGRFKNETFYTGPRRMLVMN